MHQWRSDHPATVSSCSWGDVDFFVVDGRNHRSPDRAPDNEHKRMLGDAQCAWLLDELKRSRASFKIPGAAVMLAGRVTKQGNSSTTFFVQPSAENTCTRTRRASYSERWVAALVCPALFWVRPGPRPIRSANVRDSPDVICTASSEGGWLQFDLRRLPQMRRLVIKNTSLTTSAIREIRREFLQLEVID